MSKNSRKLPVFVGVAIWEAYRFYKGKGIFNKLRYKQQHEAVSNYLETHYPNALYSDIIEVDSGWSCVVTDGGRKIMLYFTRAEDGTFIFWEKEN
ncbi:MAG: hypothetical protein IK057_00435 [Clostridia bacterium]|nr:hypothetical protein [Clostridia bacterium]